MAEKEPAYKARVGHVQLAIWRNETDGRVWYATSLTRQYRQGNENKESSNFNLEDLPVLAKAAEMAFAWILNQA